MVIGNVRRKVTQNFDQKTCTRFSLQMRCFYGYFLGSFYVNK